MVTQVALKKELTGGQTIKFESGVYDVKVDSGIEVTTDGLKVTAVRTITVDADNNKVKFTMLDGAETELALPTQSVDVKLSTLTFQDGKLVGTLSDGTTVETDLSSAVVVSAITGATAEQKQQIADALKEDLKGEEIQDSAGNPLGFLLKA